MKKYRVYQDGETNFTIQGPSPDNSTLAIFSVKASCNNPNYYSIARVDLRTQGSPNKQEFYSGEGKEKTINIAYILATNFASALDPKFEDKTSFAKQGGLEQRVETYERPEEVDSNDESDDTTGHSPLQNVEDDYLSDDYSHHPLKDSHISRKHPPGVR